jgi:hypothetical protein
MCLSTFLQQCCQIGGPAYRRSFVCMRRATCAVQGSIPAQSTEAPLVSVCQSACLISEVKRTRTQHHCPVGTALHVNKCPKRCLVTPFRQTDTTPNIVTTCQSQSHFTADSQSVSQYVLVSSPLCGRLTRYCFLFKSLGKEFVVLSLWGALSDERPGLPFVSHSLVICLGTIGALVENTQSKCPRE